ncbi:hypothetical protein [Spirosoma panaciterrae]|nr:hypothetical protein [Spirosoma panaciterrae]
MRTNRVRYPNPWPFMLLLFFALLLMTSKKIWNYRGTYRTIYQSASARSY